MKFRWPGLRGKFIFALVVAAALPLAVGVLVLQTAGFRHLLEERGQMHAVEARSLARGLDAAVVAQAGKLRTWLAARPVTAEWTAATSREGTADPAAVKAELAATEAAWPGLDEDDPRLRSVLDNPAADDLNEFLSRNPLIAELIVADRFGRLVAANRKTSDFDQSDEEWWQAGLELRPGTCWMDMPHHDASAGLYSLDVVFRIDHPAGRAVGVVKMVLDVSSLFRSLDGTRPAERMQIVLADGSVLVATGGDGDEAPLAFGADAMRTLVEKRNGWTIVTGSGGDVWMAGFAEIRSSLESRKASAPTVHVVFASPKKSVTAPVRRHLLWVAIGAGGVVLCCVGVGYLLVDRRILRPLTTLGHAARAVAGSARLHMGDGGGGADSARARAEADLREIEAIRTGDEIEALAGDVAVMTERVLRYQRELESEVEAKTSVIREDLEMAREFQHALLPSDYPESPAGSSQPLRLGFSHFYEPASTVGGDFFDLIELEGGEVAVLIADVMGHGARSALVTAILRSLVRNERGLMDDPGKFLAEMNRHLHEVISRSGQTLFVSAFFMVVDPSRERFRWAVAGHPAPLRGRRGGGRPPKPLWEGPLRQPALGLVEEVDYASHEERLRPRDVFLLYTDGLVEAENPSGEMFGTDRLVRAFDDALDGPLAAMPAQIVCLASAFRNSDQYEDDVCVVAVEASVNRKPGGRPPQAASRAGKGGSSSGPVPG